jgi:hypothetical protein
MLGRSSSNIPSPQYFHSQVIKLKHTRSEVIEMNVLTFIIKFNLIQCLYIATSFQSIPWERKEERKEKRKKEKGGRKEKILPVHSTGELVQQHFNQLMKVLHHVNNVYLWAGSVA